MSRPGFVQLQDVIMDEDFPELDTALRRGRHIDRDDASLYALLSDAQELLEEFYRRFGCELIHKTDGYFYLLPTSDKVSRRQLGPGDMLVGQALALAYLDPAAIERGGRLSNEELVAQLSAVMGSDALIAAFNPKRKRFDERVAHKNVRNRVAEAVRRLAALGFVEITEGDNLRLRPALLRFAEPVRGMSEPAEALAKLVAQGEVALEDPEADRAEDDEDSEDSGDAASDDDSEDSEDAASNDESSADDADAYSSALEAAALRAPIDEAAEPEEELTSNGDVAGEPDDYLLALEAAAVRARTGEESEPEREASETSELDDEDVGEEVAEDADAYLSALEAAALRGRVSDADDSEDSEDALRAGDDVELADDGEFTGVAPRASVVVPRERAEDKASDVTAVVPRAGTEDPDDDQEEQPREDEASG